MNQVVICSDKCRDLEKVTRILTHELVHMFDDCTAKVDWSNLRHLACSEVPSLCTCFCKKLECIFQVRAANIAHCLGPVSGYLRDGAPLFGGHTACVKAKASRSVELVGKVSKGEAEQVVSEVFARCYADLEPVGRRCWGKPAQIRAAREERWRREMK